MRDVVAGLEIARLANQVGEALQFFPREVLREASAHDESIAGSSRSATGVPRPAQEAAAIARRKAIYEELHPETKAGVAGGKARQGAASDNLSFADETSKATGKDKRSIERAAARGAALGDDLNDIAAGQGVGRA